nr:unnamed protein product [Digitaria exilis]
MAASLGLNPEALFSSYSSPFMADYAPASFPAANNATVDAAAFLAELDGLHDQFEYSPAPIFTTGAGAGDDRNEKKIFGFRGY